MTISIRSGVSDGAIQYDGADKIVLNTTGATLSGNVAAVTQSAGDNSTNVATTAFVNNFQSGRRFESSPINFTAQTTYVSSVAHGLGAMPFSFQTSLRCVIAEGGYSIGDEIIINSIWGSVTGVGNMRTYSWANSTHVGIAITFIQTIINKTTGAEFNITSANWKHIFRATL